MQVRIHYKLEDIKEKYTTLSNECFYFQSYEFLFNKIKSMKLKHLFLRSKYLFLEVLSDKNKTILILPIEKIKNRYYAIQMLDYYDLVFNKECDNETLSKALKLIADTLNSDLIFENVTENSKLFQLLNIEDSYLEMDYFYESKKIREGAKILLTESDYNAYFSKISKSNRQNIRTAYNRIEKDSFHYELKIYKGVLPCKLAKKLQKIYKLRYKNKNSSFNKRIMIAFYEPLSLICSKSQRGFTAILYINNEIAGYLIGFDDNPDNSIIIPRLSINPKYSKYSPGILLINELIKDNFDKHYFQILDLGVGDESYKKVMGADFYNVYKIKLVHNKG